MSHAKRNLYRVLGVPEKASSDEVRGAYRALAKKYHPDLQAQDQKCAKKFQEIKTAYEILGSREARVRYDAQLLQKSMSQKTPSSSKNGAAGIDFSRFKDSSVFKGFSKLKDDINFSDFNVQDRVSQFFTKTGKAFLSNPAVSVRGIDIFLELPLSLKEAVLGTRIVVPTVDGKVSLKIPKGANTGTRLKLTGKGLPSKLKKDKCGDQYIVLSVILPAKQDKALEAFLEGWDGDYKVREE
ncbi:MAG: DnaJ domain-containing protein [Alphaproteobacteria bacterium]